MRSPAQRTVPWTLGLCAAIACAAVQSAPITPTRDDEVIEVLPAVPGDRAQQRRLRQQLAQQPRNPALAVLVARRYLEQARDQGDPRFAGRALAALQAWPDNASMPSDALLIKATVQQYLHAFDASVSSLQQLLARPGAPNAQALLTLATVRRVQGLYELSDRACRRLREAAAELYAAACLAENAALRGELAAARATLAGLLQRSNLPAATRAWLTTTQAELEQRAGNAAAAEAAWRAALQLQSDAYRAVGFADFLIAQQRPAQALALLQGQVRTDAVLLRLAIAGQQAKAASAADDIAEMRERIALANQRPDAKIVHGREQAMFALWIEHQPDRALELARGNIAHQREPLDLLVLAEAARASGSAGALREVRRIQQEMGLHDRRIDALL